MDKTCVNVLLGIILHCLQDRNKMTYRWLSQIFGFVGGDWSWLWRFLFNTYSFWYLILNWETLSAPI